MLRAHRTFLFSLAASSLVALAPWTARGQDPARAPLDEEDDRRARAPSPGNADETGAEVGRFGDYAGAEALGVRLGFNGYVRFAGEVIENPRDVPFVGRNDGFKLANARLGFKATKGLLLGYVSLEAAAGEADGLNDPGEAFRVRLRDALLRFDLGRFALITLGRFKSPYDLGGLKATVRRTFVDLPLESRGVRPTQGYEQAGLGQGRQLGLMIHRDRIGLSESGFDLGYALAVTNGNTGERLLNDNDTPAAFARLSLWFGPWVQVNLAGFLDGRSVGDLPDLFEEETTGAEASVVLEVAGLFVEAQFLLQSTRFVTSGQDDRLSWGGHAQASYHLGDFELGYRFAILEPNTSDIDGFDQVSEHTASVVYRLDELPLSFFLNGTLAIEQTGRDLANNRLAALAQLTF